MSAHIIYFAICWNGLVLIGTLNGKNSISYTKSAGNLSLYSSESKTQSASETTRETSLGASDPYSEKIARGKLEKKNVFFFYAFHVYYNTLFKNKDPLSDE